MGVAIIINGADFSACNLGQVEFTTQAEIEGLSINCEDSFSGMEFIPSVVYQPTNTNERGVIWSLTSGTGVATIEPNTGKVTLKTSASNSNITIKVTSTVNSSISATKVVNVTYAEPQLESAIVGFDITQELLNSGVIASYTGGGNGLVSPNKDIFFGLKNIGGCRLLTTSNFNQSDERKVINVGIYDKQANTFTNLKTVDAPVERTHIYQVVFDEPVNLTDNQCIALLCGQNEQTQVSEVSQYDTNIYGGVRCCGAQYTDGSIIYAGKLAEGEVWNRWGNNHSRNAVPMFVPLKAQ